MRRVIFVIMLCFFNVPPVWGQEAQKAIEVFPSAPFYQYIIYETLVIFWIAIIGLLIIIRMKLKEIERVQKMEETSISHGT
jgi:hypothetical protein